MPNTMVSPSPVPRSPLVVKKGSRQRLRTVSDMPAPLSSISMMAWLSRVLCRLRMVITPPSGSASTALSMRFVIASRTSLSAPSTFGRSGAKSLSTRITTPRSWAMFCQRTRVRSMTCASTWFRAVGDSVRSRPRGV